MGLFEKEKKREQTPISTALIVGTAVFLIVWFLRSLSMALDMAAAAALFTWETSTWFQDSEQKITFQGTTSTALRGASEIKYTFQGKELISLVVGVSAWVISKFLVGKFLALMIGGVVAWRMFKWLQRLEEEERKRLEEEERKKRAKEVFWSTLGFGAAVVGAAAVGVAALASLGISNSFNGGSDGETSSDKDDKMMKAPGRDYYMPRKDFEGSPSTYFRQLRGKE